MPQLNNWKVAYSMITFFERALRSHSKVVSVRRTRDILFEVQIKDGERISVLLVDEYTLGLAAVLRAVNEFSEAEFIVTGSN